ncbi:hypothetical protein MRB53_042380 [Persea americana]|nr:hypothetical protein MRB53_042380 [Persea americana]
MDEHFVTPQDYYLLRDRPEARSLCAKEVHDMDLKSTVSRVCFTQESLTIVVKTKLESKLGLLSNFVDGKIPAGADTIASIQALNILVHEKNDPRFLRIRESFFTHDSFVKLSGGLEIYKGIFQSVRCGPGKMLLNVDTAVAVMHERGSLADMIAKFLNCRNPDELNNLSAQNQKKVARIVKGLRIGWIHRGERGLTRNVKIKGVTPAGADKTFFEQFADNPEKESVKISVATYFEKHHNRRLKFPGLPCVIVQKDNKIPMEVCIVHPGQKYSKKLDPIQFEENEYMKNWGVEVAPKPLTIKGRQLPPPDLEYNTSEKASMLKLKMPGQWDARGKKLCRPAALGSWSVKSALRSRGPTPPIIYGNPAGDIANFLKEAWVKAGNAAKSKPELIVLIVPSIEAALYGEIKRIMNCVIGCPVSVPRLACSELTSITLEKARERVPSFCAVTGSVDAKASRYFASCRAQANRQEIVSQLGEMVVEILKKFYRPPA